MLEQQATDGMDEVGRESRIAIYFRVNFHCLAVDSVVARIAVLWNIQAL